MNRYSRGLVAAAIALLLGACEGGKTAEEHLLAAQDYYAAGNLQSAAIEVRNALQLNSENPAGRVLLGTIHFREGDLQAAEKELQLGWKQGAPDAALPLLAQAMLGLGKYDEVLALPLAQLTAQNQGTVLAAQALAESSRGRHEQASLLMDEALKQGPGVAFVLTAQARLLAGERELAQARDQLAQVLQADPHYEPAWSLLGDIEMIEQNPEAAVEAYTKAAQSSGDVSSALIKRAIARANLGDFEGAQLDLDRLTALSPMHPGVNYLQGLIHFHYRRYQESLAPFDIALRDETRYPLALLYAATANWFLGNEDQARHLAQKFRTAAPDNIYGSRLLATIAMKDGRYQEAEDIMRPVIDFGPADANALNLLAQALLRQGKTDEAIEVLEDAVTLEPESADAKVQLAVGRVLGGQVDPGVEALESLAQTSPDNEQVDIALVFAHINQRDFAAATQAAEQFVGKHPDKAAPYNLLARVHQAAGREADAIAAFSTARQKEPGNPLAGQSLASIALRAKKNDEARTYLNEILKYHANDLTTLLNLAALDLLEADGQSMKTHLKQAIAAHPTAAQPRLMLARYSLAEGQPDEVLVQLNALDGKYQDAAVTLETMTLAQLAQGDPDGAYQTASKWVRLQPESAQAHVLLARVYGARGDKGQMKAELEKGVELNPALFDAQLALTRLLLLENDKDGAQQRLAILNNLAPEHPEVAQLEGSLASMRGDQQQALAKYQAAFAKAPTSQRMQIVARQQWMMDDRPGAQKTQQDWLQGHPQDIAARLALADSYQGQQQPAAAIAEYKQVLEIDKDNLVALNNLAWQLRDTQPAESLGYAKRAAELAPDSANIQDTLAIALLNNRELALAQRAIAAALEKAPDNLTARYHSAMIEAAAGNKAAASKTLTELLAGDASFREREEAVALLAKIQAE